MTTETTNPRAPLIPLYAEMAELTRPGCASCRIPYGCCQPLYCEDTIEFARDTWGVELHPTGHPHLPLMGENGCIAAPHLRPICSVHSCKIASAGETDDPAWDARYFELREEIADLEWGLAEAVPFPDD